MKIQELRQLLSTAERSAVEKAFAETYKMLTKSKKEELDPVIAAILAGKEMKAEKKNKTAVPFEALEAEINLFLENAYAQNYLAPNREVPKSERPKWRFMVKNYIKELGKLSPEDENYAKSVTLLTSLYRMLCYACNYYLFSTEDAFRSVGWQQAELYQLLAKKTFALGYSGETIASLLSLAVGGGLSRDSLHEDMEFAFLAELKTSDVKYMAMEEAKKQVVQKNETLAKTKKNYSERYEIVGEINQLCAMVLMISVRLCEPEPGIEYFFEKSHERDKEIVLYRALRLMEWMDEDELWLKIYEYGLKQKIKPRDALKKKYEGRQQEL